MIAPAKTKQQTVRCAIYTRVSTLNQLNGDFTSIDNQRETAEAYIKSQRGRGWLCVPDRYDDLGYSGATLDRPALQRLIQDARADKFEMIVFYRLDRFSRSHAQFSITADNLKNVGVDLASITEPLDTSTSAGRLILNVILSLNQYEREATADRTRDKVCAARRRGKWTGGMQLLGYDLVDGKLVVNNDEATMVREIFSLYAKHRSLQKVVAELNRRGWKTKSWTTRDGRIREGKPFSKTTLARFLANPVFIGCVSLKGQAYPGEHKGIIRKSTFDKVQSILKENLTNGPNRARNKYNHLLKGLIRCGACGTAYVPNVTKKGNRVYRYYTCSGAQKNGYKSCPHPSISAHKLEHLIVQQIRVIGQDKKLQAETMKQVRKGARENRASLAAEEKSLRLSRDKIQTETNGLLKALAGGQATGPSISNRLSDLEEQAAKLDQRLAEIEVERKAADQSSLDPNDLASALSLFDPVWSVLYPAEQARIIELLIKTIEYHGKSGKLTIAFHPTGVQALAGEIAQEA